MSIIWCNLFDCIEFVIGGKVRVRVRVVLLFVFRIFGNIFLVL